MRTPAVRVRVLGDTFDIALDLEDEDDVALAKSAIDRAYKRAEETREMFTIESKKIKTLMREELAAMLKAPDVQEKILTVGYIDGVRVDVFLSRDNEPTENLGYVKKVEKP